MIKFKNPLCKIKQGPCSLIEDLKSNRTISVIRDLMRRNKNFNNLIQKLKLPALFSIMALLSNDKVNLFNDRLVDFI